MRSKRFLFSIILVLLVSLSLFGCSSQKSSPDTRKNTSPVADSAPSPQEPAPQDGTTAPQNTMNRKIIQNFYYNMSSKTYEKTINHILSTLEVHGGYVESMDQSGLGENEEAFGNRYAHLRLRVPTKNLQKFIKEFSGDAIITEHTIDTEDVTNQFFDTEARVKTLLIQEGRLLKLLDQSKKLEDMIVLETRLSAVRYEIEGLQGTLNKLSQLVDYALVRITLNEQKDVLKQQTVKTEFGTQVIETFLSSVQGVQKFAQGLLLLLIGILPWLLMVLAAGVLVRFVLKFLPKQNWIKKVKTETSEKEKEKE